MLNRFITAFQFLTAIPLFRPREFSREELARSMGAFPLVGLALGAGLVFVHWLVGSRLPGALEGAVLVGLLAWATGAFHLDGLADTVDGLAGGWTRERALEIMKDSRTGAVGAAFLCLALLIKALGLGLLPDGVKVLGILLMPSVARGNLVLMTHGSTYARPEGGLCTPYMAMDDRTLHLGLLCAGLPCLLLGWRGVIAFLVIIGYTLWLKGFAHRRFGGITGDVLGFTAETGELLFLLTLHVVA